MKLYTINFNTFMILFNTYTFLLTHVFHLIPFSFLLWNPIAFHQIFFLLFALSHGEVALWYWFICGRNGLNVSDRITRAADGSEMRERRAVYSRTPWTARRYPWPHHSLSRDCAVRTRPPGRLSWGSPRCRCLCAWLARGSLSNLFVLVSV